MDNSSSSKPSRFRNSAAPISAVILLVTLFGHLGAIGLVGPDETRYGWIARAMAATGDWVTPRLYGQPWFEKPILYYWAGAVGFLMHLPAEWALRLPSAFAALITAIAIGWLAWKHYGPAEFQLSKAILLAPLLFSTTVAAIAFSRAATSDMLFGLGITLAMAAAASLLSQRGELRSSAAANADDQSSRDTLPLLLFGAFLGIAVLAKGPAGILLAGGAVCLWALATKKWRSAFRLAHPYAILAFCIVALPWYVLCSLRNPDFLRVFILQHNFERYLTPIFQHRQPFWFFGPITLLALLPWTVLLWPAATSGLRSWREKTFYDSPGFFFACWGLFPILFFSFSQSKLPSYILPAIPALSLVCAAAWIQRDQKARRGEPSPVYLLGIGIGITWILLGMAALVWMRKLPVSMRADMSAAMVVAVLVAFAGAAGILWLSIGRDNAFMIVSLLLVAVLVEFSGWAILPRLDPYISARWHAQFLHNNLHPDRIFVYQLPRSWTYGLAFYMQRELPEWSPSDPNPALVLTTPQGLKEIRQRQRFFGELDETYRGILYVPIEPLPRSPSSRN